MNRLTQKELVLTALAGLLSAVFYGMFTWLLRTPAPTWFWVGVVLLGVLSISVLMITVALIQHRALRWLASFLPAVAVTLFSQLQPAAVAGAGLLAIATLIASVTTRDHLDDYVKLQPRRAFWTGSQLVVIGTIAALTGLYFPILVNQLQAGDVQLSERSVEPFLRPLTPVVENLIPGYQQEQSLDQLLDKTLTEQLPAPVLQELSRELKLSRHQLVSTTALVTAWINRHMSRFAAESPLLVSLLILVPAFFTIWFLSPALLWPTIGVITSLLWLFRRLHLIRIESHPEPVDHLTLS